MKGRKQQVVTFSKYNRQLKANIIKIELKINIKTYFQGLSTVPTHLHNLTVQCREHHWGTMEIRKGACVPVAQRQCSQYNQLNISYRVLPKFEVRVLLSYRIFPKFRVQYFQVFSGFVSSSGIFITLLQFSKRLFKIFEFKYSFYDD